MKVAISIFLFIVASPLLYANEPSSKSIISRLISYANYGNGDIYVSLPTNGTVCSYGYFINKDSIGYEGAMSLLLAAYQAQTPVIITGIESNLWSGSGNPVCEIYSVEYKR